MKVAVYAISKNESKFAERWMRSMSEADGVFVLDTGSSDGTPKILRDLGATVEEWSYDGVFRFDVARNDSMKMVPEGYDILVCTDLDEVFVPGWRKALEDAWASCPGATTAVYEYVWCFNPDGSDGRKFDYSKIHAPGVCKWTHPVHEVLAYSVPEVSVRAPIRLEHHADPEKSRDQYLELLELSVKESPGDDRNQHYLGREYMFRGRYDDAIRTLKAHLENPNAVWDAERAQSMRFIAHCYSSKGDVVMAELWYRRAIDECPGFREPAVEFAGFAYAHNLGWKTIERACASALAVKEPLRSYVTESFAWGPQVHDLMSLALWYLGRREEARFEITEALRAGTPSARLIENARLMGVALPDYVVV